MKMQDTTALPQSDGSTYPYSQLCPRRATKDEGGKDGLKPNIFQNISKSEFMSTRRRSMVSSASLTHTLTHAWTSEW